MDNQKRGLSVSRIIDREKYYKSKALQLEKDLIFSNEKINALEQQLERLTQSTESNKEKQLHSEQQLKELNTKYQSLKDRYDQEIAEYKKLEEDLRQEVSQLRKNQRTDHEIEPEAYEKKVKSFERLLAEIQTELTEKDKEIETYKRRLAVMEKRLRHQNDHDLEHHPNQIEPLKNPVTSDQRAIPYLDYALIIGEKKCMIRGELIIENVGQGELGTPYICFRFTPGDAAEIKGKIMSWSTADKEALDEEKWKWAFLDTDWAEEAKERGELWIYPTQPLKIPKNSRVILSDLQIPVERQYYDQLSVEIFIYFHETQYRVKAANQILINF
ncbi:putative nucleic acid-binding Zn-ribbon protein [Pullulanibacillus pueri]|uniref:Uncharacterized protein n=1 Tax=Pullulanibacillus pueri TaxID=1437324 RepID=A0A8J2ZXC7_9BACL|nr:hypothetical protein [Pullulanibacillus pueri]MBM7680611.1 putative nucleic acid-binding Zn-ribbon protein [Pullulanibacillus pueri]GGH83944.1 hypothetical protein GCM10007096_25880 [Pullulanibacillus pueri]